MLDLVRQFVAGEEDWALHVTAWCTTEKRCNRRTSNKGVATIFLRTEQSRVAGFVHRSNRAQNGLQSSYPARSATQFELYHPTVPPQPLFAPSLDALLLLGPVNAIVQDAEHN